MLVVVSEFMAQEGLELLRSSAEVRYQPEIYARPPQLRAACADAHGLVVRNCTRVDTALLASAPHLRVVGRLGSGLDNLDGDQLRAAGIEVVSAAGTNAVATAEFTLTAALLLARRWRPEWLGSGADWSRRASGEGIELCGRTIGLVGLGRVGLAVARRARALGLAVLAAAPGHSPEDVAVRDAGAELVGLPELLRRSDVISLHASLGPGTHHLIGRRELALARPGAVLINTARGGLLDEVALAVALREGWLAGAALDVRDPEPPPQPDPLDGLPGLIRTPHIAGLSREAQLQTALQVATGVLRVLRTAVRPATPATGGAEVLPGAR